MTAEFEAEDHESIHATFVGDERHALVDELYDAFHDVRTTGQSRCVVLSARIGAGKTRIVQELYARLAEDQAEPHYWPPHLVEDPADDPFKARKRVGLRFRPSDDAEPEYLWWGVRCDQDGAGSNIRCLQKESHQLLAQVDGTLRRIARRERLQSAAAEGLGGLIGMFVPDPVGFGMWAKDNLPELWKLGQEGIEGRRQRRRPKGPVPRRMDIELHGWEEPVEEFGQILGQVLGPDLPMVLIIDDAHYADPGTVQLLDRTMRGDLPVLIVATAWPEEIRSQANAVIGDPRAGQSFGRWLTRALATLESRVRLHELSRLASTDLDLLIDAVAPNTGEVVRSRLLDIADGNPLYLRLLLTTSNVTLAIRDGAIELDSDELDEIPLELKALITERWQALPEPVRRALMLGAIQGRDFVEPLVLAAASELQWSVTSEAFEAGREHYGWIEQVVEMLDGFVEEVLYEVTRSTGKIPRADARRAMHRAALFARDLRGSDAWSEVPVNTRRRVLEVLLDEEPGERRAMDDAAWVDAALELSKIYGSLEDWPNSVIVVQRALAVAPGMADERLRRHIDIWAMESFRLAKEFDLALALGHEALATRFAKLDDHDPELLRLHHELGRTMLEVFDFPTAVEELRYVYDRVAAREDHSDLAEVADDLALALVGGGQPEIALGVVTNALDSLRVVGDPPTTEVYELEVTLSIVQYELGDTAACIKQQDRLIDMATALFGRAHPNTTDRIAAQSETLALEGRVPEALEMVATQYKALGSDDGASRARARLHTCEAWALLFGGEPESGFEVLQTSIDELVAAGGADDPEAATLRWACELFRLTNGVDFDFGSLLSAGTRARQCVHDPAVLALIDMAEFTIGPALNLTAADPDQVIASVELYGRLVSGGQTFGILSIMGAMALANAEAWDQARALLDDARVQRNSNDFEPILRVLTILARMADHHREATDLDVAVAAWSSARIPLARMATAPIIGRIAALSGRSTEAVGLLMETRDEVVDVFGSTSPVRAGLEIKIGQLFANDDQFDLANEWLAVGEQSLREGSSGEVQTKLALELAIGYSFAERSDRALATIHDLVMNRQPDPGTEAGRVMLLNVADALRRAGAFDEAAGLVRTVIEHAADDIDREQRLAATQSLANSLLGAGEPDEAVALLEGVVAARRLGVGDADDLAGALAALAKAFEAADDLPNAEIALQNEIDVLVERGRVDDDAVLRARVRLGYFLHEHGRYEDALLQYRVIYDVRRARLGGSHPETISAACSVSASLTAGGHAEEAIDLLEPLVSIERETIAPGKPEEVSKWLALAYDRAGRADDAFATWRERIERLLAAVPPDDPLISKARVDLGSALYQAGLHELGLQQEKIALTARRARLGEMHPDTLTVAGNLTANLVGADRAEEAIALLEPLVASARDDQEAQESLPHILGWLASANEHLGRYDRGAALRRESLNYLLSAEPDDVEQALKVRRSLAITLFRAGEYEEAAEHERVLMEAWSARDGDLDADTLDSASRLALNLVELQQFDEAIALLEPLSAAVRALPGLEKERVYMLNQLADAYSGAQRIDSVIAVREELVDLRIATDGRDAPSALSSRISLALAQFAAGQFDEAAAQERTVLEARRALLGALHPDTLIAASNLGASLIRGGRAADAIAVLEPVVRAVRDQSEVPIQLVGMIEWLVTAYAVVGQVDEEIAARFALIETLAATNYASVPATAGARATLGLRLFGAGRFDEAVEQERLVLETARASGGTERDVLACAGNLGASLGEAGRPEEAIELLEPLVMEARDDPTLFEGTAHVLKWLSRAYEKVGRNEEAIATLRERVDVLAAHGRPNTDALLQARAGLGVLLFDAQRFDEAIEQERMVLAGYRDRLDVLDPDSVTAAMNLAASLAEGAGAEEAVSLLEPLVQPLRDDPERAAELVSLLKWLATAYQAVGRREDAAAARIESIDLRIATGG